MPSIVAEFSYLKMLGHVYVVEDAKDLAQIVRDVTRYGGAYKPEARRLGAASRPHCVLTPGRRMYTNSFSGGRTGRR